MEESVSKVLNDKEDTPKNAGPAEYLFENSKYHDCHLKVGDPNTGDVEVIGVVTSNLVAHSSVFRHMLVDSDLADPTGANTHITDVRPEVFRLMLKHMYGGRLSRRKECVRETILELAMCADKYNVQPLVEEACERLTPTSVQGVFPALRCCMYINSASLLSFITTVVQEHTDKLVLSEEFLTVELDTLEFIAKQDKLSITELELWQSLLKWAESQNKSEVSTRQLLAKPLRHVRIATLTRDQVIDHVLPTDLLTPSEVVNLLKGSIDEIGGAGLCVIKEKRGFCGKDNPFFTIVDVSTSSAGSKEEPQPTNSFTFKSDKPKSEKDYHLRQISDDWTTSAVSIKVCSRDVHLQSFTFKGLPSSVNKNKPVYFFYCIVTATKIVNGYSGPTQTVKANGSVACSSVVTVPLKWCDGQPIILEADTLYRLGFEFTTAHPVFNVYCSTGLKGSECVTNEINYVSDHMVVRLDTPLHVLQFDYIV